MQALAGIIVGLIVDVIVTILVGVIGFHFTFTPPAGLNPADPRALMEALGGLTVGAQLAMALAWFCGALAGAWVARRISGHRWAAWTVALLMTLYVVLNIFVLPMSASMQVVWVLAPLVGGTIGNGLARNRPPAPLEEAASTTEV